MTDFTYTDDGALIVSDRRIQQFTEEWAEEFDWLARH